MPSRAGRHEKDIERRAQWAHRTVCLAEKGKRFAQVHNVCRWRNGMDFVKYEALLCHTMSGSILGSARSPCHHA